MNRLKYVFGIQVPRRIPSNTALSKSHSKGACRRSQSEIYLTKSTRMLPCRSKKVHELKKFHYTGHMKNGMESQQQESVQKHRGAAHSFRKPYNGRRSVTRNSEKLTNSRSTKLQVPSETLNETEPRSYAQMIECYSEAIYGPNATVLSDSLGSAIVTGMHRSPFSAASVVALKWKNRSKSLMNANICSDGFNAFARDEKLNNEASATRYLSRHDNASPRSGENANEKSRTSYAIMIEKYSNPMPSQGSDCYSRTGSLVPRRNVSTKLNEVQAVSLNAKDTGAKTLSSEIASSEGNSKPIDLEREERGTQGQGSWVMEDEDRVVTDAKQASVKTELVEAKTDDKLVMLSINEPAHWLDRVVDAHKKMITDKQSVSENIPAAAKSIKSSPPVPQSDVQSGATATFLHKEQRCIKQTPEVLARSKPSNPIADYIKRGPTRPGTPSQSSAQSPTAVATGPTKQPQIELRMTPSQNESVVSINVNELAARIAGSPNREQLSVIISSKKNKGMDAGSVAPSTDFGSMHVSISENTVPLKQIEFSINGKPVSELKSIVARADQLDVVSSMDKVEIRIPSKSGASISNEQARDAPSPATSPTPVLNLQIAAKFNEPRFQQPRGAELKTNTPQMAPATPPAPPTPRSPPVPPAPPAPSLPPKPSRPQSLFHPNVSTGPTIHASPRTKGESARIEATKVANDTDTSNLTNVKESENVRIDGTKNVGTVSADNPRASIKKEENYRFSVTRTDNPVKMKPDEAVFHRSGFSIPPADAPPSMNHQKTNSNEAIDERTPSNAIPWWSSEDSFKKIRKKGNTPKTASPFDDFLSTEHERIRKMAPGNDQSVKSIFTDIRKVDATGNAKEEAPLKKVVDIKAVKSAEIAKQVASVVRVRSPRRWVPVKSKNGTKLSQNFKARSTAYNRSIRKAKYRVRSVVYPRRISIRKDTSPDVSTASAVQAPKIIKYVPVTPQRAHVKRKSDLQLSNLQMARKSSDAKNDDDSKRDSTRIERAADQGADSQGKVDKANVQQSNTVLKEGKNMGGHLSKSADVSAKATSSTSKLGKEEQGARAGESGQRNMPDRPVREDPRIKEILKSMKPIEKRKDGTLIDYGVIVPSRKPAGKISQIPRAPSKNTVTVTPKQSATRQVKIIEPAKISSTKKPTSSEPKNAPSPSKTVEPARVASAKKPTSSETKTVQIQPKIMEPAKTSSAKIPVVARNVEIKYETGKRNETVSKVPSVETAAGRKNQRPAVAARKGSVSEKVSEPALRKPPPRSAIEKEQQRSVAAGRKGNMEAKWTTASVPGVKKTAGTSFTNQSSIRSAIPRPKTAPLEGTVPNPPSKVPSKRADVSGKSSLADKTKIGPAKSSTVPSEKRALLEGTVPAPLETSDKTKVNPSPLTGTGSKSVSQTFSSKNDHSLESKSGTTGAAPLEGTIDSGSPGKRFTSEGFGSAGQGKETAADSSRQKGDDLSKSSTTKTSANKDSDKTGPNSTGGITLKAQRSDTPIAWHKHVLVANNEGEEESGQHSIYTHETEDAKVLYSTEVQRPEKNLLYSSWLQRFKDRFDDDKIL